MKKNTSRYAFVALLVSILLFTGVFIVFGDRGILHQEKLKAELAAINGVSEKVQRENDQLKKEIQLLRNDPQYIENIAREALGMAKEDEIVYRKIK